MTISPENPPINTSDPSNPSPNPQSPPQPAAIPQDAVELDLPGDTSENEQSQEELS